MSSSGWSFIDGLINATACSLASTNGLHVTRRAFMRAAAADAAVMVACSRAAEEEEQETPGGVSLSAFATGPFEQDGTMFTAAWGKILLLLVLRRALPPFQMAPGPGASPRVLSESPSMP